jgi:hypothetical protein
MGFDATAKTSTETSTGTSSANLGTTLGTTPDTTTGTTTGTSSTPSEGSFYIELPVGKVNDTLTAPARRRMFLAMKRLERANLEIVVLDKPVLGGRIMGRIEVPRGIFVGQVVIGVHVGRYKQLR